MTLVKLMLQLFAHRSVGIFPSETGDGGIQDGNNYLESAIKKVFLIADIRRMIRFTAM